jgi:osmotically-inducible protein OsmY
MKFKPILACLLAAALAAPALSVAAEPDAEGDHPAQFAKDSAITAAVKTQLAAHSLSDLNDLKVNTDNDGTVWLSGTTPTREAAERAVEVARNTDGVNWVKSHIVVAREAK